MATTKPKRRTKIAKKRSKRRRIQTPEERMELEGHMMLEELHARGGAPGEQLSGTVVMVLFHDPATGSARWRMTLLVSDSVCGVKGPSESLLEASKRLYVEAKRMAPTGKVSVH